MISILRDKFNASFSLDKYAAFISYLEKEVGTDVKFRVAETPVFVSKSFSEELRKAGDEVMAVLERPDFMEITKSAVPNHLNVANEDEHPMFICVDFAVCKDSNGELLPQLIEFQGFPSLFGWQPIVAEAYKKFFDCPPNFEFFFNNLSIETYIDLLKKTIINGENPNEVILLEYKPHIQKTNVDFYATEKILGIKIVCLSELFEKDGNLFYPTPDGPQKISRIYNRVIFDELEKEGVLNQFIDLTKPYNISWAEHPNWFFRISKYTLPFLDSKYVPETKFLSDFSDIPTDLENYVLKPLFSFSGQGVIFDVKREDIESVVDRSQYILQKKVHYVTVIKAPNGLVKCEIRLLYIWPPGAKKPVLAGNLSRLSKGTMIGVRYNEDKDWVGGSVCLIEN